MTKIPLFVIIIFICVAVGTVIVNQRLQTARDRPAVQRTDSYTRLSNFAVALRAFLNTHSGKWPERLVDLERDQHLSLGYNLVKGAGLYHYRKPADSVPDDWIIMWSDTNHAPVARGQPWGAAGEVAGKDIPGVAFVLTATLHVEALTLEEFAKRSPSAATTGPASAAGAAVPAASSVTPPLLVVQAPQRPPRRLRRQGRCNRPPRPRTWHRHLRRPA